MKTNTGEKSVSISLEQLHPFEHHPFRVEENDALRHLAQSIKENGRADTLYCSSQSIWRWI